MGNKYYWLKIKKDFFNQPELSYIMDMENGSDYLLFYLKLLLYSIDYNGKMLLKTGNSYSLKRIASVTHTDLSTVRKAMKIFDGYKESVKKLLTAAEEVYAHATFKVPTGELNDLIGDAVRLQEPPSYQGRRMRVFFSSQVAVCPPVFVLHVNDEGLLHFSYQRYLENQIREVFGLQGTPIRITIRQKGDKEE